MRLTRFEKARIIGARALQLAMGAPPLAKPTAAMTALELAQIEFDKKVIPMTAIRENGERINTSED